MCCPAPRRNCREQKTQSNGHFEVSSIQRIPGSGSAKSSASGKKRESLAAVWARAELLASSLFWKGHMNFYSTLSGRTGTNPRVAGFDDVVDDLTTFAIGNE